MRRLELAYRGGPVPEDDCVREAAISLLEKSAERMPATRRVLTWLVLALVVASLGFVLADVRFVVATGLAAVLLVYLRVVWPRGLRRRLERLRAGTPSSTADPGGGGGTPR